MAGNHTYATLIVGAGFAGIGTAVRLAEAGVDDVVILERRDRVRFGMHCHVRFGHEVNELSFDETAGVWTATVADQRFRARTVVLAFAPPSDAGFPDIRGLDTYVGNKIHSARWDQDYDFTGKRVAVIGTGASVIQIVPELVNQAEFVKVFQRTPGWVLPRLDVAVPRALQKPVQQLAGRALFSGHEASATGLVWNTLLNGLVPQLGKAHLRVQVKDPWLRRQLTPDFTPACQHVQLSSDYYPALQRDNCKLIDWPIATLSPAGIRTSDGVEHHQDAIVFATDSDVHLTGPSFPVTGLGGRSLAAEWAGDIQAYKSIHAHGYPNLFFIGCPNPGPPVYIEGQLDCAVRVITTILDMDLRYLDVRSDVQRRHNAGIRRRLANTAWRSGCRSWYPAEGGHDASMLPGFASQYLRHMRNFRLADYNAVPRHATKPNF